MPFGVNARSLNEQFIRKIQFPNNRDECWVWGGLKDKNGYGKFADTRAHRFSYLLFKGAVGGSLFVCHQCDNPSCVNPSHLWLGTAKQNSQDRNQKGRQARQERVRPTISVEDALALRDLILRGCKQKEAAAKYGVSCAMASLVSRKKTWHFRDFEGQKMR